MANPIIYRLVPSPSRFEIRPWGFGVGGEIQLKITHSLCQTINLCIKPGLNTFLTISPLPNKFVSLFKVTLLSQCTYLRGGARRYKGENMSNYFNRFKMASCPFEAWWLFDPKPDRELPLWSQKWKENMLQNIRLQRNGRRNPRSDNNMNDSCVKIYYIDYAPINVKPEGEARA